MNVSPATQPPLRGPSIAVIFAPMVLLMGLLCLPVGEASALGSEVGALKRKLNKAVSAADNEAIRKLVLELGATGDPKAAEEIFEIVPVITPEDILDELVKSIASIGSEQLDPVIRDILGKNKVDPTVPALAILVAVEVADERATQWLLLGLESKIDLVFWHARDALVDAKSKPAIGKMIELLDKAKERTTRFHDLRWGLTLLTGETFELVADWKSFWEISGPTFDPNNIDRVEGLTGVAKRKIDPNWAEFFGVEIRSKRVMFVIDCSGSMLLSDPDTGKSGRRGASRQRMERVKAQLVRSIRALKKSASFNIIKYADETDTLSSKGIVRATSKSKSRAAQWVGDLSAKGATATDEALKEAFKDRNIDTIVLLTDGSPSRGHGGPPKSQLIAEILTDTARRNRLRKVRIFTFGFIGPGIEPPEMQGGHHGGGENSHELVDFLTKLAQQNGGTFTPID